MVKQVVGGLVLLAIGATALAGDVTELAKKLKDPDAEVRRNATKELADMGAGAKPAIKALVGVLGDPDRYVRRYAAEALGAIGPDGKEGIPGLSKLLDDTNKAVSEAAVNALAKMGPPAIPALTATVRGDRYELLIRRRAAEALGNMGKPAHSAVPALTSAIAGKAKAKKVKGAKGFSEDLRPDVIGALGKLATASDKETISTLEGLISGKKPDKNLMKLVNDALRQIKGRN